MNWSVKAGELVDQAITGVPSLSKEGEPIYLDNTAHPDLPTRLSQCDTQPFQSIWN